tara:strand:+ start:67786 stop:68364 length:579 start_codon:yes stop_codon:yes gene_type:complete
MANHKLLSTIAALCVSSCAAPTANIPVAPEYQRQRAPIQKVSPAVTKQENSLDDCNPVDVWDSNPSYCPKDPMQYDQKDRTDSLLRLAEDYDRLSRDYNEQLDDRMSEVSELTRKLKCYQPLEMEKNRCKDQYHSNFEKIDAQFVKSLAACGNSSNCKDYLTSKTTRLILNEKLKYNDCLEKAADKFAICTK